MTPPTYPNPSGPDPRPVHVQVCCHLDDDLYFMNPDLMHALRSGAAVVTVYLAAGEADGRNAPRGTPGYHDLPADHAAYAAARIDGVLAAYAYMATGDRCAPWDRTLLETAAGLTAETATLRAAPHIRLVFLSLAKRDGAGRSMGFAELWDGSAARKSVLVPAGSLLPAAQTCTGEQVVQALAGFLTAWPPTVLRVMDPFPDSTVDRTTGEREPRDHPDHAPAAHYALAALDALRGTPEEPRCTVVGYRGYGNRDWAANLAPADLADKHRVLSVYGAGTPGHPGDRKIGAATAKKPYGTSCASRYPGGELALVHLASGRLAAFGVEGSEPVLWTAGQDPGDGWDAPRPLDADGPVLPYAAAVGADGHPGAAAQLFAVRRHLDPDPRRHRLEVLTAREDPGRAAGFGPWISLGNPHDGHAWYKGRGIGMPGVARDGLGRVHLFVRNHGTGLSSRTAAPDGRWGPWRDLGGRGLQGPLHTVVGADGLVEVVGNARDEVLIWRQLADSEGLLFHQVRIGLPTGGCPVPLALPNGTLALLHRPAGSARIEVGHRAAPGAVWGVLPHPVGEIAGQALAAATGPAPLVAATDWAGGVYVRPLALLGRPEPAPWQRLTAAGAVGTPRLVHHEGQVIVAHRTDRGGPPRSHVLRPWARVPVPEGSPGRGPRTDPLTMETSPPLPAGPGRGPRA
ncbi:hypothetical protein ACTVZO_44105 [Streptomyces sp. IBSNAI002]|uniref:hypothetical protein n=1 Tax=Streptomyces sp. IBSNAI002 TaxID=3457500 RepID=UPI003FD506A1